MPMIHATKPCGVEMLVRIIPIVWASLLLGAHFLRQNNLPITGICVIAPCLLLIKRRWVLRVLQFVAYGGATLWIYTTFVLVRQRMIAGAPWVRMMVILLGVAALTLLAGQLLSSDVLKRRYSLGKNLSD